MIVREERITSETSIEVEMDTDRSGERGCVSISLPFLGHMIASLSVNLGRSLSFRASGDLEVDPHHLIEDCGAVLGRVVRRAAAAGPVERFGHAVVPMDGSLAMVALDISGRPFSSLRATFPDALPGNADPAQYGEFFAGFAGAAGASVHVLIDPCDCCHHGLEAAFKAMGRALDCALAPAPALRSSKGVLDG